MRSRRYSDLTHRQEVTGDGPDGSQPVNAGAVTTGAAGSGVNTQVLVTVTVAPPLAPKAHCTNGWRVPTETGDVTVHLSCTLHMAQAPVTRERRVLYTSFRLPLRGTAAEAEARERLRAIREAAPIEAPVTA